MEKVGLLDRIYGKVGHRGIKFFLYLAFLGLHTAISAASYLPSIEPNEFSVAALANMFCGGDWTAAMSKSSYYYGFLQSFLYLPAMLLTKDPYAQYRIMIIINGIIMSFVPVIVYSCTLMLGVKKPWQSISAAICSGGYMSLMIHSKFIWNETFAMFFPFLLLYLMLKTDSAEKKSGKKFLSVLMGMLAGISFCAHQRLFAMILALSLTLIISKLVLKRKSFYLSYYFISLAIFFSCGLFANYLLQQELWGVSNPALMHNTAENFFAALPQIMEQGGLKRFFISLLTQVYYFICASWGLGALGIAILVLVTARLISSKIKRKKHEEEVKPLFGGERTVFLLYAAFLTLFMLFISVCYRFGADNFYTSQSTMLFGRYLDGVIPFTIMLVMIFAYTEDLVINEILGGVVCSGVVYVLFFLTGRQIVLNATSASISPMLCFYPTMFGESTSSLISSTGLIANVSCSLCVLAVLLVIVSCSKRLKNAIISAVVLIITIYSLSFGVFYYLPLSRTESVSKNSEYVQLSKYLFNSSEAPPVTAYRCGRSCLMSVQYLNQHIKLTAAENISDLKEDTFILVPSDVQIRFDGQSRVVFVLLNETEHYRIYAYGERAKAYAQAQSGNEEPAETTSAASSITTASSTSAISSAYPQTAPATNNLSQNSTE